MELRALRAFLAVSDLGTVTAAADELHVSQPALSRQIMELERQLDLRLFDRRERRMVLTSAGRQFADLARDLVVRAELARKGADAIRSGALPSVTLCSPGTTLTDVIAPFLATWGPDDPMPRVWEDVPSAIYHSLARGADLAIGTEPPPAALSARPTAVLPVWAYVAAGHPWADRGTVPLEELAAEPLLVLTPEQHARRALDSALVEIAVHPASVTGFEKPEVAQAVAAAGRGVAIVSDDARFDLAPLAITVDQRMIVVRLFAAWEPEHHAAATLQDIADRLSDFCLHRYGTEPITTSPPPPTAS